MIQTGAIPLFEIFMGMQNKVKFVNLGILIAAYFLTLLITDV